MAGQHHALMKDADDGNTVFALTVDDNMGTHQIGAMRCGQIFPLAPQLRIVADGLYSVVQFVAVTVKLILSPFFSSVPQDVNEILLGSR